MIRGFRRRATGERQRVVAAPGITEEDKQAFIDIVTEWHATPEWQDALARNNWEDTFSTGEEFEDFIDAEVATAQQIVKDLGL